MRESDRNKEEEEEEEEEARAMVVHGKRMTGRCKTQSKTVCKGKKKFGNYSTMTVCSARRDTENIGKNGSRGRGERGGGEGEAGRGRRTDATRRTGVVVRCTSSENKVEEGGTEMERRYMMSERMYSFTNKLETRVFKTEAQRGREREREKERERERRNAADAPYPFMKSC